MTTSLTFRNHTIEEAAQIVRTPFVLDENGLLHSRCAPDTSPDTLDHLILHAVDQNRMPLMNENDFADAIQALVALVFQQEQDSWIYKLPGLFCLEHTLFCKLFGQQHFYYEILHDDSLVLHLPQALPHSEVLIQYTNKHSQAGLPGLAAWIVDLDAADTDTALQSMKIKPLTVSPTGTVFFTALSVLSSIRSDIPASHTSDGSRQAPLSSSISAPDPQAAQPGPSISRSAPPDATLFLPDGNAETISWW